MNEPVANEKRSGIISFSKSIFSKFIFVFGLLTAGIYLFTLTGRFFFLAELACNFRFQIMLTLAATGILSVVVKRYRLACVLAFLALLATSGTLSMYYPISKSTTASQTLKIMSFNVLVINRNYQAVIDEVAEHDPDVVTIIEYSKNGTLNSKGFRKPIPIQSVIHAHTVLELPSLASIHFRMFKNASYRRSISTIRFSRQSSHLANSRYGLQPFIPIPRPPEHGCRLEINNSQKSQNCSVI